MLLGGELLRRLQGDGELPLDERPQLVGPETVVLEQRLREAIAQLPRKQRATLILRMYHEMPHQEIAEVLGSSVGAVKANFFHALGNLKKILEKDL